MTMLQKDLAIALKRSDALISRWAKRGMPTDSVPAAEAWIRMHVRPKVRPLTEHGKNYLDAELQGAQRLMNAAAEALRAGNDVVFEALVEPLQAAMRELAYPARGRLGLDVDVMDRLLDPVRDLLDDMRAETEELVATGRQQPETETDRLWVGAMLYSWACRETFNWSLWDRNPRS